MSLLLHSARPQESSYRVDSNKKCRLSHKMEVK